jgi:hypothetical protein
LVGDATSHRQQILAGIGTSWIKREIQRIKIECFILIVDTEEASSRQKDDQAAGRRGQQE